MNGTFVAAHMGHAFEFHVANVARERPIFGVLGHVGSQVAHLVAAEIANVTFHGPFARMYQIVNGHFVLGRRPEVALVAFEFFQRFLVGVA